MKSDSYMNKKVPDRLDFPSYHLNDTESEIDAEQHFRNRIKELFDEYGLSPIAGIGMMKWIKLAFSGEEEDLDNLKEWLLMKLNRKRKKIKCKLQFGCPEIIPTLTATPFWNPKQFKWYNFLRDKIPQIREELLELRGKGGFQPYRGPKFSSKIEAPDGVGGLAHDKGNWNVFYLLLHNMVSIESWITAHHFCVKLKQKLEECHCTFNFFVFSIGFHRKLLKMSNHCINNKNHQTEL